MDICEWAVLVNALEVGSVTDKKVGAVRIDRIAVITKCLFSEFGV